MLATSIACEQPPRVTRRVTVCRAAAPPRASRTSRRRGDTMAAMHRGHSAIAIVALVAATTPGCGRLVEGTPAAQARIPLPQLLIDPSRFPDGYPPAVLDGTAAERALRVVDGAPAGSTVSPAHCAPPAPGETAAVTGSNGAITLTVAVSRLTEPLRTRRDQLTGCPAFTVDGADPIAVNVLAAPPVVADDSYAVAQTTAGPAPQDTLTLVAQLGDVTVTASARTTAGDAPDTEALDGLFTQAVLKVAHPGQA